MNVVSVDATWPQFTPALSHLAILLPPFDLIVTSSTNSHVRAGQYLVSLLRFGIVSEGEAVLMLRGASLLLLLGSLAGGRRHGCGGAYGVTGSGDSGKWVGWLSFLRRARQGCFLPNKLLWPLLAGPRCGCTGDGGHGG